MNFGRRCERATQRQDTRKLLQSKRGDSAIIANLIIFVGVMAMASATVIIFKTLFDDNSNEVAAASGRTVSVLKTDFTISSAAYNGGVVYVYVKNTGKEQFDPDDLDIYIDDMRIPRNETNRTVSVSVDTDTINAGIWDEKEEIEFQVFQAYAAPVTHSVRVSAPNGVKDDSVFSS